MMFDFWKWLAAIVASLSLAVAWVSYEANQRGPELAPVVAPAEGPWIDACGVFHDPPAPTAQPPLGYCPTPVPQAYP